MTSKRKKEVESSSGLQRKKRAPGAQKEMKQLEKLYNDCVHGHITLPPLCSAIINTSIFDRLRNLKQMGFTYYVYPGASHNRFEHSIGVCHLAGCIVDILNTKIQNISIPKISDKEKVLIQVAGLCHDLGHGPFSHSWEDFVNKANGNEAFKHEDMSLKLFDKVWENEKVKEERDQLFEDDAEDAGLFVKELIEGISKDNNKKKSKMTENNILKGWMYYYEIISNKETGIDVDKWDYLLRDGKQLNLKMTFDSQRLMQCLRICEVKIKGKTEYHICYRDKEMDNIMQMYVMKGELHKKAAQHRVERCINEMWIDVLMEAEKENYQFYGKPLSKAHEDLEVYEKLIDNIFHDLLYQSHGAANDSEKKSSQKLLERIVNRKLYTCVWRETVDLKRKITQDNIEETKQKMKRDIYEKVKQKRAEKNNDLFVTHSEQKMHYLPDKVFLYEKTNVEQGKIFDDESKWKSALVFPIVLKEMIRIEMFFYFKKEEQDTNKDELKRCAKGIMEEIKKQNS